MQAIHPQHKITTLEQYEALPEERRVEVFDGVIYDMSSPFYSVIKVNIYEDLYINFSDISSVLNI